MATESVSYNRSASPPTSHVSNYRDHADFMTISCDGVMHSGSSFSSSDAYLRISTAPPLQSTAESSIAVGQDDSMLLDYNDDPSQLYNALLHSGDA